MEDFQIKNHGQMKDLNEFVLMVLFVVLLFFLGGGGGGGREMIKRLMKFMVKNSNGLKKVQNSYQRF